MEEVIEVCGHLLSLCDSLTLPAELVPGGEPHRNCMWLSYVCHVTTNCFPDDLYVLAM